MCIYSLEQQLLEGQTEAPKAQTKGRRRRPEVGAGGAEVCIAGGLCEVLEGAIIILGGANCNGQGFGWLELDLLLLGFERR